MKSITECVTRTIRIVRLSGTSRGIRRVGRSRHRWWLRTRAIRLRWSVRLVSIEIRCFGRSGSRVMSRGEVSGFVTVSIRQRPVSHRYAFCGIMCAGGAWWRNSEVYGSSPYHHPIISLSSPYRSSRGGKGHRVGWPLLFLMFRKRLKSA